MKALSFFERPCHHVCHALGDHHVKSHQAVCQKLRSAHPYYRGLDLVRGNAVKVLTALAFTSLALALFAWRGTVYWPAGLSLGAGTLLGGQLGVYLTILKGQRWIRGVVTLLVIIFALRLWWTA